MCRFIVILIIVLCAISYVFAQKHRINRRGIQIRGSFGQGTIINDKNSTGDGFLNNRFGEYSKPNTGNRRIQIRGSYGGSYSKRNTDSTVFLANRFSENNNNNKNKNGCISEYQSDNNGIGCKSISLNEILNRAGLGGGEEEDFQARVDLTGSQSNSAISNPSLLTQLVSRFGSEGSLSPSEAITGNSNNNNQFNIEKQYLPPPTSSRSLTGSQIIYVMGSSGSGLISVPYI